MTYYDGRQLVAFRRQDATAVLLALRLLAESYPRELARVLETGLSSIQQALRRLEADGLVAGRVAGRTKLYRINQRYFAYNDLQKYLLRLTEPEEQLKGRVESLRRRPRRTGKRL